MLTDTEIIDALGGNAKVADLCECSRQAVQQWRADGIPKARRLYLKAIRPDLFRPLESAQVGQHDADGGPSDTGTTDEPAAARPGGPAAAEDPAAVKEAA